MLRLAGPSVFAIGAILLGFGCGGDPFSVVPNVDCSALTEAGWDLCDSGPDFCAAVFDDGAGCQAVCAAADLECAAALDNVEGACAPRTDAPELGCFAELGHQSDYCLCVADSGTG